MWYTMLNFFEVCFVIVALWLVCTMIVRMFFMNIFKNNEKASEFVAFIGLLILLYAVTGIILGFIIHGGIQKFLIFLFAASPFIIGKFATYEKERLFSLIQIASVVISIVYVTAIYY